MPDQSIVSHALTEPRQQPPSWLRRHSRSLLVVGVLLIAAILAAAAAASWYFSSAVVVPNHRSWPLDATVTSVFGERIVLSRSKDSLRPGVYGLDWKGGHAVVEEVTGSGSHTVTRQLRDVQGQLTPGMKVAIDPDTYPDNPQHAFRLRYANVSVPDELAPMPAWVVPAQQKQGANRRGTWAIVVHGLNGSREDDLRMLPPLHAAGLTALLITYREDAGAPQSPDHKHHMGLTEWRDLQAAARYALAHGAKRLVLYGMSMGGSIVTQFMERSPLARSVSGLVLDAPALDWKAILSFNAKEMGLPSFATTPVEWMIGERISVDWDRLDALRHTAALHLPILLFHGTSDQLVPISTSDAFAAKLKRWVTYYRVPGARHVESWNRNPYLYDRRVERFLARVHA